MLQILDNLFSDECIGYNHIDEIKGIYVPYWLFDADVDADDANVPETNENVSTEQTDISTENSSDNNEDGQ